MSDPVVNCQNHTLASDVNGYVTQIKKYIHAQHYFLMRISMRHSHFTTKSGHYIYLPQEDNTPSY